MGEPLTHNGPDAGNRRSPYQRILYETARVLAESPTLVEAVPPMIRAVCEGLDWQYGALWEVDRARNVLHCVGMWQPASLSFDEFAAVCKNTTFAPGVGLPGRVWASRQPAWIPDVTRDTNFPRAPIARKVGLHAAFGVPAATYGPFYRVGVVFAPATTGRQCLTWPHSPRPTILDAAPAPDVPVLVLAGEDDVRAPIADGRAIARRFRIALGVEKA